MKGIYNNIDDCMIFNYAYAQSGELDYLYHEKHKHGKGETNSELIQALTNMNEQLQGDKQNDIVDILNTLEQIKLNRERYEWAHELVRLSILQEDRTKIKKIFKEAFIPFDLGKIKAKIGALTTSYNIKYKEYQKLLKKAEDSQFKVSDILNGIPNLNLILEGKYVEAKTTSVRDFMKYSEAASSRIEAIKRKK